MTGGDAIGWIKDRGEYTVVDLRGASPTGVHADSRLDTLSI
jgi:hypothetical protein